MRLYIKYSSNGIKKQAIERIHPLALEYAKNLGVQFNECKISEMKYRWDSCTTKNNINFS